MLIITSYQIEAQNDEHLVDSEITSVILRSRKRRHFNKGRIQMSAAGMTAVTIVPLVWV